MSAPLDWTNKQVVHEFSIAQNGIPLQFANKDVPAGIAVVQLFTFKTCENLIKEMRGYSWHPQLDRPLKQNDDGPDALRYALASDELSVQLWSGLRVRERRDRVAV